MQIQLSDADMLAALAKKVSDGEPTKDDSKLDYTLEYDDDTFYVTHDGVCVTILDCDGYRLISFNNYADALNENKALPADVARIALSAYHEGHAAGEKHGYFSCQYDVKKVLGLR